jgi:O-acetyl-ADP-ribose deacetylase (regulator of RNase III)
MEELRKIRADIGRCPTGSAVVTAAGNLPAKYVFHAVGPIYRDGRHGEPELLISCYDTCMKLAAERGVVTINFPSISTGVYGFPIERASRIALREIARFLAGHEMPEKVVVVTFSGRDHRVYQEVYAELEGALQG